MHPILFALACDGIRLVQLLPAPNAEFSVAILATETQTVFRKRGGELDGWTVVAVERDGVLFRRGDATCSAGKVVPVMRLPERTIARAELEAILEAQGRARRPPCIPEQENGRVVGLRFIGIKPNEGLARLGIENGDRLETVNGFDITQPEKALEAYARLRSTDHLVMRVTRRGVRMDIELAIE